MCAIYGELIARKKAVVMREEETPKTVPAAESSRDTARPWTDLTTEDDSIGEAVRSSLDEIRYA